MKRWVSRVTNARVEGVALLVLAQLIAVGVVLIAAGAVMLGLRLVNGAAG